MAAFPSYIQDHPHHIPQTPNELADQLMHMVGAAPTFKNENPRHWRRSAETEYLTVTMGLENVRKKIGEERFEILTQMSANTRAVFESHVANQPEDQPAIVDACLMLQDMMDILLKRKTKATPK